LIYIHKKTYNIYDTSDKPTVLRLSRSATPFGFLTALRHSLPLHPSHIFPPAFHGSCPIHILVSWLIIPTVSITSSRSHPHSWSPACWSPARCTLPPSSILFCHAHIVVLYIDAYLIPDSLSVQYSSLACLSVLKVFKLETGHKNERQDTVRLRGEEECVKKSPLHRSFILGSHLLPPYVTPPATTSLPSTFPIISCHGNRGLILGSYNGANHNVQPSPWDH
jgi:hypothetical protein